MSTPCQLSITIRQLLLSNPSSIANRFSIINGKCNCCCFTRWLICFHLLKISRFETVNSSKLSGNSFEYIASMDINRYLYCVILYLNNSLKTLPYLNELVKNIVVNSNSPTINFFIFNSMDVLRLCRLTFKHFGKAWIIWDRVSCNRCPNFRFVY